MATSIIDPDNGAGTDYLYVQDWIAGRAGQADTNETALLRPSAGSNCSNGGLATIDGFNATTIDIRPESATYKDARIERINGNFSEAIRIDQENATITITDTHIKNTGSGTSAAYVIRVNNDTGIFILDSNRIEGMHTGTPPTYARVLFYGTTSGTRRIATVNNWVYGDLPIMLEHNYTATTSAELIIYNDTFYNKGSSDQVQVQADGLAVARVINNIIQNPGGSGINLNIGVVPSETSLTNITQDISGEIQAVIAFSDAANDDYDLAVTDTAAIDTGTDLSADATYPFNYDFHGATRPEGPAWDIGGHELVQATGPLTATGGYVLQPFTWSATSTVRQNLAASAGYELQAFVWSATAGIFDTTKETTAAYQLQPFNWSASATAFQVIREATAGYQLSAFTWSASANTIRKTETATAGYQLGIFTWAATSNVINETISGTAGYQLQPFTWSATSNVIAIPKVASANYQQGAYIWGATANIPLTLTAIAGYNMGIMNWTANININQQNQWDEICKPTTPWTEQTKASQPWADQDKAQSAWEESPKNSSNTKECV